MKVHTKRHDGLFRPESQFLREREFSVKEKVFDGGHFQGAMNPIFIEHFGENPNERLKFKILIWLEETVNIPHKSSTHDYAIGKGYHFPIAVTKQPVYLPFAKVVIYSIHHNYSGSIHQLSSYFIF